jgi:hypothetical protein
MRNFIPFELTANSMLVSQVINLGLESAPVFTPYP